MNNDLQHLQATRRLSLTVISSVSGNRGPLSVKAAAKLYPEQLQAIYEEIRVEVIKAGQLRIEL